MNWWGVYVYDSLSNTFFCLVVAITQAPPNEDIVVINFGNGAHHSDLNHFGPMEMDTIDFVKGYQAIRELMGQWLKEIRHKHHS